ncbi:MAG: hypothetical protein AAF961_13495, partial [Planctomycetota bacterium]
DAAAAALRGAPDPAELALLAQPGPDYFAYDVAAQLSRVAPLIRPVVVAGTWCEGEVRTGAPPPGAVRLYWHEFPTWWRESQTRVEAGACPAWSQPLVDLHAGRWSVPAPDARDVGATARVSIAVDAVEYSSFAAIEQALDADGFSCEWLRPGGARRPAPGDLTGRFQGGIWDGSQLSGEGMKRLAAFTERFEENPAPVAALVNFPRLEHLDQVRSVGAATVLGKPYCVAALVAELRQLITNAGDAWLLAAQ